MTRVDFYLLPDDTPGARLLFACRLTEQIHRKDPRRIYLHTESESAARELDEALWSFRPDSFVPHGLLQEAAQPAPAIQIGYGQDPGPHHEVLINLTLEVPDFFSRFERVAEIVSQEPTILQTKRHDWKFYQDRGYPLHRHDMRRR